MSTVPHPPPMATDPPVVSKARVAEAEARSLKPLPTQAPRGGVAAHGDSSPKLDDAFFHKLIESRTDETGRTWVKIGAGLVLLGVVGSIGTFARIARRTFTSGITGNALATVGGGTSGSVLSPMALIEKETEAVIMRARIEELQKRIKDRHPLWYPGDTMP